jgi:hypothetical protein
MVENISFRYYNCIKIPQTEFGSRHQTIKICRLNFSILGTPLCNRESGAIGRRCAVGGWREKTNKKKRRFTSNRYPIRVA